MTATNDDSQSNENVKTNGILLRHCHIYNIVGQISPSYVFGHHGLWPSWFVDVMVCGRHGCGRHGLWPSWFVAVMVVAVMVVAVMVVAVIVCGRHRCGRHGLWPSLSNLAAVIGCN